MPFKSEAQRRYFHVMQAQGKISPEVVKEWEDATPKKAKKKLPYHVKKGSELEKLAAAASRGKLVGKADASARQYTLRQRDDGKMTCTCGDYKFRQSAVGGECKHIKAHKSSKPDGAPFIRDSVKEGSALYTYVPKDAVADILENGLHSGKSLLKNTAQLEAAAKGRGETPKEFRKTLQRKMKSSWDRPTLLGPNAVFHDIPAGQELSKKHPTKVRELTLLAIDFEKLKADNPGMKLYGMELKPYQEGAAEGRHRFIGAAKVKQLQDMSPEEYWRTYNDVEDRGLYAPDVPHVSLHTPSGLVEGKYLSKVGSLADDEVVRGSQEAAKRFSAVAHREIERLKALGVPVQPKTDHAMFLTMPGSVSDVDLKIPHDGDLEHIQKKLEAGGVPFRKRFGENVVHSYTTHDGVWVDVGIRPKRELDFINRGLENLRTLTPERKRELLLEKYKAHASGDHEAYKQWKQNFYEKHNIVPPGGDWSKVSSPTPSRCP